jgi:NADPH:quinone reductase-like Zn-dependent oxidoreductase
MTGGATDERAWYALQLAADLINEDRFSLPVAQTFGLDEIAEAHRLSETGHVRGKIIVLVD